MNLSPQAERVLAQVQDRDAVVAQILRENDAAPEQRELKARVTTHVVIDRAGAEHGLVAAGTADGCHLFGVDEAREGVRTLYRQANRTKRVWPPGL